MNTQWYERYFPSSDDGAAWALNSIPSLFVEALEGIRGKFSRDELMLMLDVMHGEQHRGGSLAGHLLPLMISDAFELHPGVYEDRYSTDADCFRLELEKLPRFTLACLEIWACGYTAELDNDVVLDDWLLLLAPREGGQMDGLHILINKYLEQGGTKTKLCEAAGVSRYTLHRFLKGQSKLNPATVAKLQKAIQDS